MGVVVILALHGFYQATLPPIVVTEKCDGKTFHDGKREALKITDSDVKQFIENWIGLRYNWSEFNPEMIVRNIEPVSTFGFVEKLKEIFGKKKADNSPGNRKDDKLEEMVTNIRVTLSEKDALASFDQILRINGIPLIVPTEVSLQIVKGSPTRWNPLGLYVNGAVEHEEK